ncbi:hypothetical protein ES703_104976 [subsurface metagenome]
MSYQASAEAVRIAEQSGDSYSKAAAYTWHGFSFLLKGLLEEAERYLMEGVDFGKRLNHSMFLAMAHDGLGETYFEIGEYEKSKDHYSEAIWLKENAGFFPSWTNLSKIGLARAKVMNNEKDIEPRSLYGYVAKNKTKIYDGSMRRYIGEILLSIDDQHMSEAEEWIKKAIESDKRNGAMWNLGMDHAICAELFKRKGDRSKAKENFCKAIETFKECGADGWAEKAEQELATLS